MHKKEGICFSAMCFTIQATLIHAVFIFICWFVSKVVEWKVDQNVFILHCTASKIIDFWSTS